MCRCRSGRSCDSTPWNGDRAAWARSASVSWNSPPLPGLQRGDLVEHVGREHVAADQDQIARCVLARPASRPGRARDHAVGRHLAGRVDHAVGADLVARRPLEADDAATRADAHAVHLGEQRRSCPSTRRAAARRTARRRPPRGRSRRRGRGRAGCPGRRSSPASRVPMLRIRSANSVLPDSSSLLTTSGDGSK